MKVSLTVFHRYSYKDRVNNNNNNNNNDDDKIDVFCTGTQPRVVSLKDNIESFVENLIDEYTYNFEKKINEQHNKGHINFLNIELLKIRFYGI